MDHILNWLIHAVVFLARFTERLARIGIGSFEAWKPGEKRKILLVGYNGARNTGADARVVGIAEQIQRLYGAENVSITVMTLDRSSMEGYFPPDVKMLEFSTFFPWALYKA